MRDILLIYVDNPDNPEGNKQSVKKKKKQNWKIILNYTLTKGGMMVSTGPTGFGQPSWSDLVIPK